MCLQIFWKCKRFKTITYRYAFKIKLMTNIVSGFFHEQTNDQYCKWLYFNEQNNRQYC